MDNLSKDILSGLPQLANARQVANALDVSVNTLNAWRYRGTGPRFVKLNGVVRYPRRDLARWFEQREAV